VRSSLVPIHYYLVEGVEDPKVILGKALRASIVLEIKEPIRVIPKAVLLRHGVGENWSERLDSIYPGAEIIALGDYEVAVRRG
jgi:hypothetical protein